MNVATLAELKIGETFQFGTIQPLSVGDMIGINKQYSQRYGIAEITKDLGNGFYEAKRIS